jgi:hypothetical protein
VVEVVKGVWWGGVDDGAGGEEWDVVWVKREVVKEENDEKGWGSASVCLVWKDKGFTMVWTKIRIRIGVQGQVGQNAMAQSRKSPAVIVAER